MQIELIGCTCAGKSTLARRIVQYCGNWGLQVTLGREFVARRFRLHYIPSRALQILALDLVALCACLATLGKNAALYGFAVRTLFRSPATWYHKYRLLRRVLRQIGICEILRRASPDGPLLLVDEGSLHAAHSLFVHARGHAPDPWDLSTFLHLTPLPDLIVMVKQSESELIERTKARGHKRIPRDDYLAAQTFIRQAVELFDWIAKQPAVAKRLLVVSGPQGVVEGHGAEFSPEMAAVRGIIRNAMHDSSPGDGAKPPPTYEGNIAADWSLNR
jgi:hypothetical protein